MPTLPALDWLSPQHLLLLEIGVIALVSMLIGLWVGSRLRQGRARREASVYSGELRRTQSRLRAVERAAVSAGRNAYGTSARRRG